MKKPVTNRPLTRRQKEIKARKWRLIAGELYVDLARQQIDGAALDHLRAAHDAMCEAFMALEEQSRVIVRYDKAAIMARAWEYFRACQASGIGRTLGDCLRDAWTAARYDAYAWRYGCSTDLHLIFIIDA